MRMSDINYINNKGERKRENNNTVSIITSADGSEPLKEKQRTIYKYTQLHVYE